SGDCNHRGILLQFARGDLVQRVGWSVMITKIKAAVLHWTECRDSGLFHRLGIRADMFRQIQTPSSNLLQNLRDPLEHFLYLRFLLQVAPGRISLPVT